MSYIRYKKLRKYVNGVPTDEYKKSSELYDTTEYESYEDCMKGAVPPTPDDIPLIPQDELEQFIGENIKNHPFYNEYFTVEALEDGRYMRKVTNSDYMGVYYRKNKGEWISLSSLGNNYISVSKGDKIELKRRFNGRTGIYDSLFDEGPKSRYYGNANSLINGDNFLTKLDLDFYDSTYRYEYAICACIECEDCSGVVIPQLNLVICYLMFTSDSVSQTPSKLKYPPVLPATEIGERCYRSRFSNCTSLEKAPVLPAKVLEYNCYTSMFYGCSKLNYVKCLAKEGVDSYSINGWLSGVSPTGTFVKKRGVYWPSGNSGIPSGWTVEEVD